MNDPAPTDPHAGEQDAGDFEGLLTAHQHRIYFFIRSMVFNPEDARDVLQDVNAVILRKRDRFTPGTSFVAWSFAIARFECLTFLRRYRKMNMVALEPEMMEHLAEGVEERIDDMDYWLKSLAECRKLLSDEGAELIILRYQRRMPLEEIATRWKTTEGALKQKLFRIRNQLKTCILKRKAGMDPVEP